MNPDSRPAPAIDLPGLHLLRTIAEAGSLSRAAGRAGLTQSGLTRQLQTIEARLGLRLFDRTTRRLALTPAGASLLTSTAGLSEQLDSALRRLREEFLEQPRTVRLGLSRSVALAHVPGLLHGHTRQHPEVSLQVSHGDSGSLLDALVTGTLDLAVVCPPRRMPAELEITHRMPDAFTLVAGAALTIPAFPARRGNTKWPAALNGWLSRRTWLLLPRSTQTGTQVHTWMDSPGVTPASVMEIDSFDLMLHLVALDLGVALVPRRALATFPWRDRLQQIPLPERFVRELAVVTRRGHREAHVEGFVASILFS